MAGQTPSRHDRAAARDNAGHAPRRERDIGEPNAGVDVELPSVRCYGEPLRKSALAGEVPVDIIDRCTSGSPNTA